MRTPSQSPPAPEPAAAGESPGADGNGCSRRDFLRAGAAATAGLIFGCDVDGIQSATDGPALDPRRSDLAVPPDLEPPPIPVVPPEMTVEGGTFGLGVATGDVTRETAVAWTRYSGAAPLALIAWQMDGERYAVERSAAWATPADGGFVHVELVGLSPGARYRYAFFEMNGQSRVSRSRVGAFRAALAEGASEVLTLGAVSCTKNGRGLAPLEHAAGRSDLDAFLLLGDTTYNDGARTLSDYRGLWAENLSTAGYRALRAATSVYATWDDHEVGNNWDPETIDQGQLTAARNAFFENLPVGRSLAAPDRIWRRFTWGRTADLFVLDSRGERRPSTRRSQKPEYLSRVQMDWLKAGLASSKAAFQLILNSVPISEFGPIFNLGADDRWTGYGLQRSEILEHIDRLGLTGVVWVSGDFHFASMGRVATQGAGSRQIELLTGPGGQIGNPLQALLGNQKNIDWSSQTNNYTVLRLDPATREVRVSYVNGKGETFAERSYRP